MSVKQDGLPSEAGWIWWMAVLRLPLGRAKNGGGGGNRSFTENRRYRYASCAERAYKPYTRNCLLSSNRHFQHTS